jgi:hypothetical protein
MTRHHAGFVAVLGMVLCLGGVRSPASVRAVDDLLAHRSLGQSGRVSLDAVLAEYLAGDVDVVKRTFVRSLDFQNRLRLDRPRELDRWLGSWDRGKAMLLLECARTSAVVAPQYVFVIVGAGRRYLASIPAGTAGADGTAEFVRVWHRAAIALLQGASDPARIDEHGEHVANLKTDARFLLARAVAHERRCWGDRPSIDQPAVRVDSLLETAGVRVPDNVRGPIKSERESNRARHSACLREALTRFEAVVGVEDVAAEALVRGGWILLQDDRPKEAIEWLDAAKPGDDRDLAYWHQLFRGRALEALGRSEDAATAYRAALAISPRAQSAGLGLSIALMRLDRAAEADEIARSVREGEALTPDPWLHYTRGDERFVGRWYDSLRAMLR